MGLEISLKFADKTWLPANKPVVERIIRQLPSYIHEADNHVFWLKDSQSESTWEFDVRLFLQEDAIFIEVSSFTNAFRRDTKHLITHIGAMTSIQVVDDDGEIVAIQ